MSIEKAKIVADIVKIAQDVWYAHSDRAQKKKESEDAKERRIKELEQELERMKGGSK